MGFGAKRPSRWVVAIGMLAAGLVASTPAAQAEPGIPPDAHRTAITVHASGQCLHPGAIANNARVKVEPCSSGRSNTWDVVHVANEQYVIRVSGTNRYLTAPRWADYYGVLYDCPNYADQLWVNEIVRVEPLVRWMVKVHNVANGKCLTGPWWAPGSALGYQCLPYADQEWWVQVV